MLLVAGVSDSGHNDASSGYLSSVEDVSSSSSVLQHENQLLKNEIASLNQEMQSVIHRVQATQEGYYCIRLLHLCKLEQISTIRRLSSVQNLLGIIISSR